MPYFDHQGGHAAMQTRGVPPDTSGRHGILNFLLRWMYPLRWAVKHLRILLLIKTKHFCKFVVFS